MKAVDRVRERLRGDLLRKGWDLTKSSLRFGGNHYVLDCVGAIPLTPVLLSRNLGIPKGFQLGLTGRKEHLYGPVNGSITM
jgi:hypothetical protein